jgi:hypothetical protein
MPTRNDPLKQFREGVRALVGGDEQPLPLISTTFSVEIRGGIAAVTSVRTFRNQESHDIEPTMTFPVPVDAALCSLKARIDGRELVAVAAPKEEARETYEVAIDSGKSAVLHEELIKGVHMLNAGRVAPGAEVAVTSTFVVPLSFAGDRPGLRIPTTVGEIFGRSPLLDSDDLAVSDDEHRASVRIACDNGKATLLGRAKPSEAGGFEVSLDAPIDIAVSGWKPQELKGRAADGRELRLRVSPLEMSNADLDVDLLSDRSGSMNGRADGDAEVRQSKFEVAKCGLRSYAEGRVGDKDRVRVWEFSDSVNFVGEAVGSAVPALVEKLQTPSGGTEFGVALDALRAGRVTRNVVLVTDGKTWAFDPQKYARCGMRITAVLIGEDALEGGVSHLAGITGGQVFVPLESNVPAAIAAAMDAARLPFASVPASHGRPDKFAVIRRGARIEVELEEKPRTGNATDYDRWVGALSAYLSLPSMEQEEAAALAAQEGIVCHLTSLVLVDDAAETRDGVPATRKVAMSRPRSAMLYRSGLAEQRLAESSARLCARSSPFGNPVRPAEPAKAPANGMDAVQRAIQAVQRVSIASSLEGAVKLISWNTAPDALRQGDLSSLSESIAETIRLGAARPEIDAAAKEAGLDPVVFMVGLLARAAANENRTAARIARVIFGPSPVAFVAAAAATIGL